MLDHSHTAAPARSGPPAPLANETSIQALALAVRHVCGRLSHADLEELRRSAEQAALAPRHLGWDSRAAAHARIFALLADAADDPVVAGLLNSGVGLAHYLMLAAGPTAGRITVHSDERLLALLSVGDADGAANEVEGHLRVLRFYGRLVSYTNQTTRTAITTVKE
jgi:DNA-binding GntR family transcriptional regulator